MITAPIFLVLYMHIGPTRFLEDGAPNTEFDADERLHIGSTGLDWDDCAKIAEAIAADEDDKDEKEDSGKRIGDWRKRSNIRSEQSKQKLA